ncbi:MAG: TonB-dependent receptor [Bacteroidales bacterium]|nr:TonB-dependent receptor [Bacteroidales bacterium]
MRSLALVIILLTISAGTGVFAQSGSITGVVTDKATNDKIPFANIVAILKSNTASVKGTVSDKDGKFGIDNLPFGNYNVVISFIGYEPDTIRNIDIDRQIQQVNIGEIQLSAITFALGEVVVKDLAETATAKLDRITYNVRDFETTKGGNASDVLNKLPSVSIDPDGVISVRGTSDFMVYLNGKPSQMEPSQLLAQIPASTIESIDVITVPSAKYDAQGKGGIINITTKKTGEKGMSVSASVLTGGAPWGNYTDQLSNYSLNDNRLGGSLNFIYNKNKLSLYGGSNFNKKDVNGTRPGYARLLQENGSYYHMMVSDGLRPEWSRNYTANAAMDYQLNNRSVISASYFYGNRNDGRSAFYKYHNFYGDEDKNPITGVPVEDDWIYNPNKRNRYGIFHTANIDYTRKTDNNSELKISALFEHSELRRDMDNLRNQSTPLFNVTGDLEEHFIQTDDTPLDGYRLSVDYTKKLNNGHTLSLGIQPQYFLTSGSFSFDTLNVLNNIWGDYNYFENAIDFRRGIYAGYADYSGSAGKFKFLAGLRLEYTDQVLDMENPDYFTIFDRVKKSRYDVHRLDWFPSIHLSYNISEKNKVTIASSRRISRPPLINMTPFLYREHYEVYVVGDPALEPEYLTSLELAFNNKAEKHNISLTGYYRGTDNAVFRVNTVYEEENVLIRSYTNSANTRATGMELAMNFEAGTFGRFIISSSVYNFKVEADIFEYKENNRSTNWSLKGNANFMLTESLKFTIDFDMKSATVTAQGRDEMFYMANTSLNYTPNQLKGWDFSLKALDILRSNITRLNTRAYDAGGTRIFYQEIEYNRYGPIVELNVSYAFNMTGKSGKKIESSFGKEQF